MAVLIILLIGLFIRLLPLLPPEINLIRHVPDDAYYLYCEADNLAHGKGLSFDGVNPTTSSRPLYVVFLAGVDCMVGRSALPQTAYLLGVIADILTALLILRFLRKVGIPPVAAILGMVFYISSAKIIFYGIDGMETPFAILSVIILLNLYLLKARSGSTSILPAITRGITLAVMMLLRLDYIFIVVPVILYELWLDIKQHNWDWFWVGATIGLIMAPWVWWSFATNGSLLPPSSDALTIIFRPKFSGGFNEIVERILFFINTSNTSLYLVFFLFKYIITSSIALVLLVIVYIIRKFEINGKYKKIEPYIVILLISLSTLTIFCEFLRFIDYTIIASAVIYYIYLLVKRHNIIWNVLKLIGPVAIGFIALSFYYTTIRLYIRPWNTIEVGLLLSILLGALCAVLLKRRFGVLYIGLLFCWVMTPNVIIASSTLDKGSYASQERFVRVVAWMQDNIPPGTVVAAANGGIIQWYGGRTLVDAAGIEDVEAYRALKSRMLYDYLIKRNVQYLIDPEEWPFKYYIDHWGVDISKKLIKIYDSDPLDEDKYTIPAFQGIKPIVYKLE